MAAVLRKWLDDFHLCEVRFKPLAYAAAGGSKIRKNSNLLAFVRQTLPVEVRRKTKRRFLGLISVLNRAFVG